MGIIRAMVDDRYRMAPSATGGTDHDPMADEWYLPFNLLAASPALSGVNVTETSSLQLSTVWACVRIISEGVAGLPLGIYQKKEDGGDEVVTKLRNHPLYRLLHTQPNPEMTAFQWRETGMHHVLLWGNHYSQIAQRKSGTIDSIWPLDPSKMVVRRNPEGRLKYYYTPRGGGLKVFDKDEILHVAGLGFNGLIGYSVVSIARNSIGLAMGLEEFHNRFLANDASPGGIIRHPQTLSKTAHENLNKSLSEQHMGLMNRGRPMILEEGMDWKEVTMPLADAQFLESRRFQIPEICRWFNVPPHKIQEFDRATWGNVEQSAIDFVIHTLRPWLVRLEQFYKIKLLSDDDQKNRIYPKHTIEGLLRGDIKSRYDAYAVGRNWGWLSADDVRRKEDDNPLPDGKGKIYLQPANAVEAGTKPVAQQKIMTDQSGQNGQQQQNGTSQTDGAGNGRSIHELISGMSEDEVEKTIRLLEGAVEEVRLNADR